MVAAVWLPGAMYHVWEDSLLSRHLLGSVWHGIHVADLLMALFLFCCGAAAAARVESRSSDSKATLFRQAWMRSVLLIIVGLLTVNLAGMIRGGADVTITGPLQQIGVAVLVSYTLLLILPRGASLLVVLYMLVNHGFLLATFVPDQPSAEDAGPLAAYRFQSNLVAWVDAGFLPGIKSFGNWDRFGILPTGIGTSAALIGACYQQFVLAAPAAQRTDRLKRAVLVGIALVVLAWSGSGLMPINHYLWTVTFVGFAMGVMVLAVSILQLLFDHPRGPNLLLLRALGRNSLLFFLICCLVSELPLTHWHVAAARRIASDWQSAGLLLIVVAEVVLLSGLGIWLAGRAQYFTLNRLLGEGSRG